MTGVQRKDKVDNTDKSVFGNKMSVKLLQTNTQLSSWLSNFNKAKSATTKRKKIMKGNRDIQAFIC